MIETIGAWIIANMTLNPIFIGWTAVVMAVIYAVWIGLIILKMKRHK